MLRYLAVLALSLILVAFPVTAFADSVSGTIYSAPPTTTFTPTAPVSTTLSLGVPPVSSGQFVAKIGGIATRLYNLTLQLAPYVLLVVFGLLLFGFIVRSLWRMALFAALGFVIVWLAPMLVGLIEHGLSH